MYTHNLDPVLIDFGVIAIRWYSLAYIIGIILGWWLGKKILTLVLEKTNLNFNVKEFDDLISYLIISIIIGGRCGYIIFYNLSYYISNPLDIIKLIILFKFISLPYHFMKHQFLNSFISFYSRINLKC